MIMERVKGFLMGVACCGLLMLVGANANKPDADYFQACQGATAEASVLMSYGNHDEQLTNRCKARLEYWIAQLEKFQPPKR